MNPIFGNRLTLKETVLNIRLITKLLLLILIISSTKSLAQTTVSSKIASSFGDSEERWTDNFVWIDGGDLDFELNMEVGLHFENLNIPSGVTINSAYIQFTADEVNTGISTLNIYAEAVDNPLIWTSNSGDISARTKTTVYEQWSPPDWNTIGERGNAQKTSDISSVIQEIVDRPGYSSSNAINIIISYVAGTRRADSYDAGVLSSVPELFVSYSDAQEPTAPTLSSQTQTDTTVDLNWTASTDNVAVTGYRVYKDGILETTLGNVLTYQVTGLTASTSYDFKVTALDAANNESVDSNTLNIATNTSSGGGSGNWTLNNQNVYYNAGNVGIGTSTPDEKLAVNGSIHTKEVRVNLDNWSDFVFEKDYKLPSLEEVENHIKEKGHLKDIPSAKEVEEKGVFLGEMDSKLLQKIEELTLYTIQQQKEIQKQEKEIEELKLLVGKLIESKK
ncbi:fibronectin type III domain-containing protein [Flavivirga aquimarina]|uniref:Fibronectin type III domain-containing protein n=1 Tax=Flavivirga aquimarina TaxID=2027862 RepID=A0ABT8WE92_9FLAO|nr:fibronectin type III domain-containing protein [Flavivirga aquimarina]MDO5971451.1 fibronectin type III domain-containing protein [Flavivirga aquimarina]